MDESWKVMFFKRILPGILCVGIGFGGLAVVLNKGEGESLAIFGKTLFCFPFMIMGAVFLSKPLASWIATPFVTLLYPEDHSYTPPPIYRLPEMYVRQGRATDAAKEYQKILRHHPNEIRAYLALLEVSFQHLNDIPLAQKTYKTGMRRLKSSEDLAQLEQTFQALQAGAPLATSAIANYP